MNTKRTFWDRTRSVGSNATGAAASGIAIGLAVGFVGIGIALVNKAFD